MKNIFFLIATIFLTTPVSATAEGNTAIIASDHWCPYTCDSKNKDYPGFSVDLIREALRINGWDSEYINAPFLRVNSGVLRGVFHILPATLATSSPELLISKEPVAYQKSIFTIRKGTIWRYEGIGSLEKVTIGVIAGYTYSPEIDEYIRINKRTSRVQVLYSNESQEQNLRKLMAGRIDAYLEDENVIRYFADKLGLANQTESAGLANEFPVYCGLGTDDKARKLAEIIDDGIRKLQRTEAMKRLVEKYGISNWR